MSNLLSPDLTSALRVAVEQSRPRSRGTALLTSVQAADKAISTGATSSESNKIPKPIVIVLKSTVQMTSLVTGGLFFTDATQANSDLRYTSEAQMVSANEQNRRSTFTIIA